MENGTAVKQTRDQSSSVLIDSNACCKTLENVISTIMKTEGNRNQIFNFISFMITNKYIEWFLLSNLICVKTQDPGLHCIPDNRIAIKENIHASFLVAVDLVAANGTSPVA